MRISVTDTDGTPPCIGELRLFADQLASAISDRGADLPFESQQEAAGAQFTDNGKPASPLLILDHHGFNYVCCVCGSTRRRATVTSPPT